MAAIGNTSWVCDPSLASYALEQPEMLRSPDYKHKCHAPFKCAPTVYVWDNRFQSPAELTRLKSPKILASKPQKFLKDTTQNMYK